LLFTDQVKPGFWRTSTSTQKKNLSFPVAHERAQGQSRAGKELLARQNECEVMR
jgi:hypothetical protein